MPIFLAQMRLIQLLIMIKIMINDYIITYRSFEHYEVLGWIKASSLEEAKNKANKEFEQEIKKYGVMDAMIAEWKNADNIHF